MASESLELELEIHRWLHSGSSHETMFFSAVSACDIAWAGAVLRHASKRAETALPPSIREITLAHCADDGEFLEQITRLLDLYYPPEPVSGGN